MCNLHYEEHDVNVGLTQFGFVIICAMFCCIAAEYQIICSPNANVAHVLVHFALSTTPTKDNDAETYKRNN